MRITRYSQRLGSFRPWYGIHLPLARLRPRQQEEAHESGCRWDLRRFRRRERRSLASTDNNCSASSFSSLHIKQQKATKLIHLAMNAAEPDHSSQIDHSLNSIIFIQSA
ncbi:MAG: hypothetical protein WAN35_00535 [Terracidiphilus sp.]